MSHKDFEAMDKQRIIIDGPERFSDKCATCGHSRSDHLVSGVRVPISGRNCRVPLPVEVIALDGYDGNQVDRNIDGTMKTYRADDEFKIVKVPCNCMWKSR